MLYLLFRVSPNTNIPTYLILYRLSYLSGLLLSIPISYSDKLCVSPT